MRFIVLGPLEVISADDALLSIGGPKKRAALGYLLLHVNEVVATSQLVEALWPGEAPSTARKMVQNTVSEIRRMLAEHDQDGCFALLTHSPGYLLRAAEHAFDLLKFQQLAKSGRQALVNSSWTEASDLLGRACRLWRGDALADLADAGVNWPELATLRQARLTTLEDYFEAELAAGHHYDHLAELDRLVSAQPHRERACRQLMLALYRCGRQVDALDTYRRTRAVLTAKFGVEPTNELREMEEAILRHDKALIPLVQPSPPPRLPLYPALPTNPVVERKLVSILTVAFDLSGDDRAEIDDILAELGATARAELIQSGAVVVGSTGSSVQAVFGVPRTDEQDGLATVRAALAIRDRFTGDNPALRVRLVVSTAETRVKLTPEPPEVTSSAFEEGLRLVRSVPPGRVWVCGATRLGAGRDVVYTHHLPCSPDAPALWCASDIRDDGSADPGGRRLVDRDHELAVLTAHVDQVARRGRGWSITVLGQAGMGKTRLVAEFARTIAMRYDEVEVLTIRIPYRGSPSTTENASRALETLVGWATATAVRHPLVVVIEDLHRADEDLLRLFDSLVEHVRTAPLLVISTARRQLFDRGRLFAHASTIMVLDRLSDKAVRTLWESVLGDANAPLTPELSRRIDGNPLFAIEFALQRRHDPSPTPSATLPPRVYRAIAAELDGLPQAAKQILRSAAPAPDRIEPDALSAIVHRDVNLVRDELDDLARRHLLRHTTDRTTYAFAHPLVRDVLYSQLPKSGWRCRKYPDPRS